LRFGPAIGDVGASLCRYYLELYYKAVFANGLNLPQGQYTFIVAGEFQDIVKLQRTSRFNDSAFTAKAREFNNIMIMGTQSLAALLNKGGNRIDLESFVNNCNNRIMMYSDDPVTLHVYQKYEELFRSTRVARMESHSAQLSCEDP
jgi:hypothetical protein